MNKGELRRKVANTLDGLFHNKHSFEDMADRLINLIQSNTESKDEWKAKGKNEFGLDCNYYSKELFSLNETLHCRTPEEMKRYFLVLADSVYIPPTPKQGSNHE